MNWLLTVILPVIIISYIFFQFYRDFFSNYLITLVATLMGVFIAFQLEKIFNVQKRNKIYNNLKTALKLEFENNLRIIQKEQDNIYAISFETFKSVFYNEIFIEHALEDAKLGKAAIENIWHFVSDLRKMKNEWEKDKNNKLDIVGKFLEKDREKEINSIIGKLS